jgi:hypothetical protein
MSSLVFGACVVFIGFLVIKSLIPSKKVREERSYQKAKENLELRVSGYEKYLINKGIKWEENMDGSILALACRESPTSAIVFYMHKAEVSLSASSKYVEKLCLENGVSTEVNFRLGHKSVLS